MNAITRTLLAAAAAALASISAAEAATLNFPSKAPTATVTVPDDWRASENTSGMEAYSPDGAVSFYIDLAPSDQAEKIGADGMKFVLGRGITLADGDPVDTTLKVNGTDFPASQWKATDQNGPITVTLAGGAVIPSEVMMITYWSSPAAMAAHQAEIKAILGSIKPAN